MISLYHKKIRLNVPCYGYVTSFCAKTIFQRKTFKNQKEKWKMCTTMLKEQFKPFVEKFPVISVSIAILHMEFNFCHKLTKPPLD